MTAKKGTTKATGRNYDYDRQYLKTPEQRENNRLRKAARRAMEKKVGKAALKGKDVDHKTPLKAGGSNRPGNLRVMSPSKNRARK